MSKLKYIAAILLLFMVSFVGGCGNPKTAEADEAERFVVNKEGKIVFDVYTTVFTDKVTGVQYLHIDGHNSGCVVVLVDAEGKPLVDKE
ncbi:MAG: hypothetical protein J6K99_07185 [Peptococcaceae bacterium]|nr:hypothetical protein [Peptococcaceae bacterium]